MGKRGGTPAAPAAPAAPAPVAPTPAAAVAAPEQATGGFQQPEELRDIEHAKAQVPWQSRRPKP